MKTKRFRLLTVFLTVVMLLALSLNVYAAKSNAATRDGITAQLFTDKDAYKVGDKVNANVQVENNSGRNVFVFTNINLPEGVVLASGEAAQDALLQDGETWSTSGVILSASDVAAGAAATGDNMQAGFWVIVTALAVGGFIALFVYGKNNKTWLSVLLCMAMVGGLVIAAVPAQAADMNGDIQLSCTIQVDGKEETLAATVSYVIYDETEEEADETVAAPTEAPTTAPIETEAPATEPPSETDAPATEPPSETDAPATEPPSETDAPATEPPSETDAPATEPPSETDTPAVEPLVLHVSVGGLAVEGCSEETHYADIAAAQVALRSMDHSERPVEIIIHAGTYNFSQKVTFEAVDSGSEEYPVVYKAAGDGEVYFSGSTTLDAADFEVVSDETVKARLPEKARDHVMEISLAEYKIAKTIVDLKSRYTYANRPLAVAYLYLNDKPQTLSRYPNEGYEVLSEVIEKGDTWPNGGSARGTFGYVGAAPDRWTTADQAYICGYLRYEYCRDWVALGSVDAAKNTITLADPTTYGMVLGGKWFVTNLLEEIDLPGEYFIDANEMKLYYYPTEQLDAEDKIELTAYNDTFITLQGVEYVEFNGIHFQHTLANGLVIDSSSNITVRNCDFNDIESDAIVVNGRNNLIEGCTIYEVGLLGVNVIGGGDPVTYSKSNNRIANNHFWNVARQNSMLYQYAIQLGRNTQNRVIGDVVENNIIHGQPGAGAIIYGGLDNVIRYNEIYALYYECADAGLIYAGRRSTEYGNLIEYNYIHDYGSKFNAAYEVQAIYWDDWQSGQTAKNNIIVPNSKNSTAGNLMVGANNTFSENVIVNSHEGVSVSDRNIQALEEVYNQFNAAGATEKVLEKYPQITALKELLGEYSDGKIFPVVNNVVENNLSVDVDLNDIAQTVIENGTVQNNQITDDYSVFVDAAKHDYRLTTEAMTKYNFPETMLNATNFTMDRIGIQSDVFAVKTSASEFSLLYPANGQTNVSTKDLYLKWEEALFADEYEYVVATDADFTETTVVATGTVYRPIVKVEGLENGKTYYYKVTAKNLSKQIGNTWESAGSAYMFTTPAVEVLNTAILKEEITKLKAIDISDTGENIGQFKAEVTGAVNEILARAEELAAQTMGVQSEVDDMVTDLQNFIKGINGYRNSGCVNLNVLGDWGVMDERITVTKENGLAKVATQYAGAIAYPAEKIKNYEAQLFKLKSSNLASGSWFGIALRQTNTALAPYNSKGQSYLVIVKKDAVEFQKYNPTAAKTGVIATYPNDYIKDGEWCDIEFGAIDVIGGVQISLKVNGNEVFSYLDTENPIYEEGYFTVRPGSAGEYLELMPTGSTGGGSTEPENPTNPEQPEDPETTGGSTIYYANDYEDFSTKDVLLKNLVSEGTRPEHDTVGATSTNQIRASVTKSTTAYINAMFDKAVDSSKTLFVEVTLGYSGNKPIGLQLQYPYKKVEVDGTATYDMNTLLTLSDEAVWTAGLNSIEVGSGSRYSFAFKIDLTNGTYTIWTRKYNDLTGPYTQIMLQKDDGTTVDTFTLNALADGYTPEFIRVQLNAKEDADGMAYIDNFAVYNLADPTVYYANDYDDTATIKDNLDIVGVNKGYVETDTVGSTGTRQIRIAIPQGNANSSPYINANFGSVVNSDNIIVEATLGYSGTAGKDVGIQLQYPYKKLDDNGTVTYEMNTLLTIAQGGTWTAGLDNIEIGKDSREAFAFKIDLKEGTYTIWHKDHTAFDSEYTQVVVQNADGESVDTFSLEPLEEGYVPEFVRVQFSKTDLDTNAGMAYIDNFAVYSMEEDFLADPFGTTE